MQEIIESARKTVRLIMEENNWSMAAPELAKMQLANTIIAWLKLNPMPHKPCEDTAKYYEVICDKCSWSGCSKDCGGGGQIADTGDYSDPTCPICFSNQLNDL